MKICCRCGESKPSTEFNFNARHSDGLASECRACRKVIARASYERNRDKIIQRALDRQHGRGAYEAQGRRFDRPTAEQPAAPSQPLSDELILTRWPGDIWQIVKDAAARSGVETDEWLRRAVVIQAARERVRPPKGQE